MGRARQTTVTTTKTRTITTAATKVPKSSGSRGSNKCPVCGKYMSKKG